MLIEIIIISLIAAGAIVYFILYIRKELKGESPCGNKCNSCNIKETCNEIKPSGKTDKKIKIPGKRV
jgi:hypothetical protein